MTVNPYEYTVPPKPNMLMASTKLKAKFWPLNVSSYESSKTFLFFSIGLFIGFLVYSFLWDILIASNSCIQSYNFIREQFLEQTTISRVPEDFSNSKKSLLYIGVMTANKFLGTRVKAIFETWGKDVPGKIEFFTSEKSDIIENLPLVRLRGVDDTYPPQKKSFLMLKYMYDNYLNDFEYFMRVDDDAYLRVERLEKFLRSINSSKLLYIGQAGKGNSDELGRLSLKNEENFCMGGPGMVFSKRTIEKLGPNIKKCIKNLKSSHEDVEVGRCVQKYVGVPCTWSYEMQNIFYHRFGESQSFTGPLNIKEIHRAITLHPVKDPYYLSRLHVYLQSLTIQEKEFELVQGMRDVWKFSEEYDVKRPSFDDVTNGVFLNKLGVEASLQAWAPKTEEDMLTWNFMMKASYQLGDANPRKRISPFLKEATNNSVRDVMETINRLSKVRGRVIHFTDTLYGYYRHNPSHSSEFILDMLLLYRKYKGKKMTVSVRRHAYIQIPFGPLYVRESPDYQLEERKSSGALSGWMNNIFGGNLHRVGQLFKLKPEDDKKLFPLKKRINFILPLSGRLKTFKRFLDDFKTVCLDTSENVRLIIVLCKPQDGVDTTEEVERLQEKVQQVYPQSLITLVKLESEFSRAVALERGAAECGPDDLLFFIDVDMTFTSETLEKIRSYVVQGKQVYYPIVFSEVEFEDLGNEKGKKTKTNHFKMDEKSGSWRAYGFGIAAMYQSDLRKVGGFNTSILGWGKEDVDLFQKVMKTPDLTFMRAPDSSLVHIFHRVECDSKLEETQLKMCKGSQHNVLASISALTKAIIQNPNIIP